MDRPAPEIVPEPRVEVPQPADFIAYPPGTPISIPIRLKGYRTGLRHVAIVSDKLDDTGRPMIVGTDRRTSRVLEETWAQFAEYPTMEHSEIYEIEQRIPAEDILARARSQIGSRQWKVRDNCEHFVHWCCGYAKPRSVQLRGAIATTAFLAGAAGFAALVANELDQPVPTGTELRIGIRKKDPQPPRQD